MTMRNLFDLAGRRAIITGGGGGIGSGLVAALYGAGAEVLIIGRSESAAEVASAMGSAERPVLARRVDLADREALAAGFAEAVDALSGLDILVNCHGTTYVEPSLEFKIDAWDQQIESNLTSVFLLCQLAARIMVAQGRGKIINIASMLSYSGGLRAPAYAAAKGGIVQLTKALANEWSGQGVNVNAIAPGYVRTKLNMHIWKDPVRSEQTLARIPAGRWGEAADLQGAVIFLASPASDYIHGITLPVDGGFLAR
jgi:2-deoxy-D-gluconate 3-dehydrogenase